MSMYEEVIVGRTNAGKEIAYRVKEGEALKSIYFTSGGQVPACLDGLWTDERQIVNQVNAYLANDTSKPKVVAKKKSSKTAEKK